MKNRLLVLGGAGFIGSHIVRNCLRHDLQVGMIDGLVKGTGGSEANIQDLKPDLEFACFQRVDEVSGLSEYVDWAEVIIDAMAFTGHFEGFAKPLTDIEHNLLAHVHLINALKDKSAKRVVYLGSRSQYGRVQDKTITEQSNCEPLDPQGINKLAAEHFLRIYSRAHGFSAMSLRMTNCFGPNQKLVGDRGLVGGFIQDVLDDKPIEIFGSAERLKSILFVEDAARVVVQSALKPWSGFEIFNLGGMEVSIEDLLKAIFSAAGKGEFSVKPFPEEVKRIDVGEARFNDDKLRHFLGRNDQTSLSSAVESTVEYFKQNQLIRR